MRDAAVPRAVSGPPPRVPFHDDKGKVHLHSCGPHVDVTSDRLKADRVRGLVPHLALLVPRQSKSHVAIYLSPELFSDESSVNELRKTLPHCEMFDRSHYLVHVMGLHPSATGSGRGS